MAEPPAQLNAEIDKYQQKHLENPDGRYFVPLANAYRKLGEFDRSERLLRDGLRQHPDYLSAHIVLGRTLADRGSSSEAAAEFKHVLGIDPQNLIALRSLGELAAAGGQEEEAGHWYRELLAVDPMNDEARQALSVLEGDDQETSAPTGFEPAASWWESPAAHPEGNGAQDAAAVTSAAESVESAESDAERDAVDTLAIDWSLPGDSEAGPHAEDVEPAVPEWDSRPHVSPDAEPELESAAEADSVALPEWGVGPDAADAPRPGEVATPADLDAGGPREDDAPPDELELESLATIEHTVGWNEPPSGVDGEVEEAELQAGTDDPGVDEHTYDEDEVAFPSHLGELAIAEPEPEPEPASTSDAGEGAERGEPESLKPGSWELDPGGLEVRLEGVGDLEVDERASGSGELEPEPEAPQLDSWAGAAEPIVGDVPDFAVTEDDDAPALEFGPPFDGADSLEDAAGDDLVTETMAELYASQGFTGQALEVYRELVRLRGEKPGLVRRIAELEAVDAAAAEVPPEVPVDSFAESFADGFGSSEPGLPSAEPDTSSVPDDEGGAADLHGEPLAGVGLLPGISASDVYAEAEALSAGADDGHVESEVLETGLASEASEFGEPGSGRTAAEYFAGLLAWRPATSWAPRPSEGSPDATTAGEESLDRGPEPVNGLQEEPAGEPSAGAAEPAPVPIDELAPSPGEIPADEDDDLFPWELPNEALAASEDPDDRLETAPTVADDHEDEGPAPGSQLQDRPDPVAAPGPSTANEAASQVDDDDDLESFQAWLRSLKR